MKASRFAENVRELEALLESIRAEDPNPVQLLAVLDNALRRIKWKPQPQATETTSDALGAGTIVLRVRLEVLT